MPDDPNLNPDGTPKEKPPETVPKAMVDEIIAGFAKRDEKLTAAIEGLKPAPAATPAGEDPQKKMANLMEQVDTLSSEGKHGEAMRVWTAALQEAANDQNVDVTTTPAYRASVQSAEARVRGAAKRETDVLSNAQIMEKWGGEVRAALDALPPEERILNEGWEKAIGTVVTAHGQEVIRMEVEAKEKEINARWQGAPPVAGAGGAGPRAPQDKSLEGMEEVDFSVAKALRLDPKDLAEQKKFTEDYQMPDGSAKNVPLLPDPGDEIPPGTF